MSQELDKTVLIGVWLVSSQSSLAAAALEHLEEDLAGEGFTGICRLQFTRDVKKLDGGKRAFLVVFEQGFDIAIVFRYSLNR